MIFQDVSFLGYVIPITLTVLLIVIDLVLAVIFYRQMGLSFIKCFSNFLWATFVGWELALYYLIGGLLCCITIILIPIREIGVMAFRLFTKIYQHYRF